MHPPLGKPHPDCGEEVRALLKCHEDHPYRKVSFLAVYVEVVDLTKLLFSLSVSAMNLKWRWIGVSGERRNGSEKPTRIKQERREPG